MVDGRSEGGEGAVDVCGFSFKAVEGGLWRIDTS